MVRYVALFQFTENGIKNFSETVGRANAFQKLAQKAGASVKAQYWTAGSFDGVLVLEAPDETTALALFAKLGSLGNVRTQSLRAFDQTEMETILAKAK